MKGLSLHSVDLAKDRKGITKKVTEHSLSFTTSN